MDRHDDLSEPERVSREEEVTIRADRLDFLCRSAEKASCASVGEVHALACELRTLRAQLADRDNHIKYAYAALGDANRNIYLFDHIRKLKGQLAEKDAAIELLRGANRAQDERERKAAERVGMVHNCDWPDDAAERILELQYALAGDCEHAIHALAAKKKEG